MKDRDVRSWFVRECMVEGHGLLMCESRDEAIKAKAYLDGYLRLPFTSCVIREKEVNVYSVKTRGLWRKMV